MNNNIMSPTRERNISNIKIIENFSNPMGSESVIYTRMLYNIVYKLRFFF